MKGTMQRRRVDRLLRALQRIRREHRDKKRGGTDYGDGMHDGMQVVLAGTISMVLDALLETR